MRIVHVPNRALVVPGELLAEGDLRAGRGAYKEGQKIFSSVVGLVEIGEKEVSVIALEGCYEPRVGDDVVGVIVDSHMYGWIVDINSPYMGDLYAQDLLSKVDVTRVELSSYLKRGDLIFAKIGEVTSLRKVKLQARGAGYGKLKGGRLVEITPVKTPRVIGKRQSMLSMIQSVTGCILKVGQNGRIIIMSEDDKKISAITEALYMIEREAHTSGLTDRVKVFLEKRLKEDGGEKASD
jgi:exosome complex component RRP4